MLLIVLFALGEQTGWAANSYKIYFNPNGGTVTKSGNFANTDYDCGVKNNVGYVTVTTGTTSFCYMGTGLVSNGDYKFAGWFTDPIGGTMVYSSEGCCQKGDYWDATCYYLSSSWNANWTGTADLTLYAHWEGSAATTVTFSNVSNKDYAGTKSKNHDTVNFSSLGYNSYWLNSTSTAYGKTVALTSTSQQVLKRYTANAQATDCFDMFQVTFTAPSYTKVKYVLSVKEHVSHTSGVEARVALFDYNADADSYWRTFKTPTGMSMFRSASYGGIASNTSTMYGEWCANYQYQTLTDESQTVTKDITIDNSNGSATSTYIWYGACTSSKTANSGTSATTSLDMWVTTEQTYCKYVTFNANNGYSTTKTQLIETSGNLTSNTFTRVGYTFGGWSTTRDGAKEYEDGQAISVDKNTRGALTLYAVWIPAEDDTETANYIDTNGDQTVQFGYDANSNSKISLHFRINSLHSGVNTIMGATDSKGMTSNYAWGVWVNGSDKTFSFASGCTPMTVPDLTAEIGKDYYVTLESGYFEIDSVADSDEHIYHKDFAVYPFNTTLRKIHVGACNVAGKLNYYSDINIYDVAVSENDTAKYHLVPAYVISNDKTGYGLYDMINEKSYVSYQGNFFEGQISICKDGAHPAFTCHDMSTSIGGSRSCVVCGYAESIDTKTEPYLTFNGETYFNTGYIPNYNTEVKMHFVQHENKSGAECQDLFGLRLQQEDGYGTFCALSYPGYINVPYTINGGDHSMNSHGLTDNHEYYLTMSIYNIKITTDEAGNNVVLDKDIDSPNLTSSYELPVGAIYYVASNAYGTCKSTFDLFSFDIYEEGVLKHSFTPEYISEGTMFGFRDSVDGTFHPMVGSCDSSSPLQSEPNYISTNGTAYLNTGYVPNDNSSIYTLFRTNSYGTHYVFGTANSTKVSGQDNFYLQLYEDDYEGNIAGSCYSTLREFTNDTYQYIRMSKSGGLTLRTTSDLESCQTITWDASSFTNSVSTTLPIYAGAVSNSSSTSLNSDIKIYAFDITENGVYKRHFIPAKRDGQVGFYEAVGSKFYTMDGVGATGMVNECAEHKYLSTTVTVVDGQRYRKCLVCDQLVADSVSVLTVGSAADEASDVNVMDIDYTVTAKTKIRLHAMSNDNAEGYWIGGKDSAGLLNLPTSNYIGVTDPTQYSSDFQFYKKDFNLSSGEYYITYTNDSLNVDNAADGANVLHTTYTRTLVGADVLHFGGTSCSVEKNTMGEGWWDLITTTIEFKPAKYDIVSLDIYEGDSQVRHFVPAKQNGTYGLYDTYSKTFTAVSNPLNSKSYVAECSEHNYLDYIKGDDGIWRKHCRVCDNTYELTDEELASEAFIYTNCGSYLDTGYKPTSATSVVTSPEGIEYDLTSSTVTVGTKTSNVNSNGERIYSVSVYEGDELQLHFIPSIYNGSAAMYETVNGKFYSMTPSTGSSTTATAYVPECIYHRYYTIKTEAGNYYKHCCTCDALEKENVLIITSSSQLSDPIPETGYDIYLDMAKKDNTQQYISTKYPVFTNDSTFLFDYAVMNRGMLKHHYIAGKYNNKYGVYDTECDTFIVISGANVKVVDCYDHKYAKTEMTGGQVIKHCYLCDSEFTEGYYYDIAFNANGGSGTMDNQTIVGTGTLNPNAFLKDLGVFAGWKVNNAGSVVSDGTSMTATAQSHGSITLYAQWENGFTYNGDTLAIKDANTNGIHIVDDGVNGFATSSRFTATNISFTRTLADGIKYGTVCLPFAITSTDDVSLYEPKSVEENVTDGSIVKDVIHLEKVESVAAGVPCIFRLSDSNASDEVTFECASCSLVDEPVEFANGDMNMYGFFNENHFVCDDSSVDYYGVTNDHFTNVTTSLTVKPYRGYITRKVSASAKPITLYLDFGEGSTGIELLSADGNAVSLEGAAYYSADGRRIPALAKGINIVKMQNGKTIKIIR